MKTLLIALLLCATHAGAQTVDLAIGANVAFPKFNAAYGLPDLDGGVGFAARLAVVGRSGAAYFGGAATLSYINGSQQIATTGNGTGGTERRAVVCGKPFYGAEAIAGASVGPGRLTLRIGGAAGYAAVRLPTYATASRTMHGFSAGVDVQPELRITRHTAILACVAPRYVRVGNGTTTLTAVMVPVMFGLTFRPQ